MQNLPKKALLLLLMLSAPALAANLIVNPGFEQGLTGWYGYAGGSISSSTNAHSGARSVYVYNRAHTYEGIGQSVLNTMSAGETYKITAWVKADNAATAPISITIYQQLADSSNQWHHVIDTTCYQDRWVKISGYYTLAADQPLAKLELYFESPPVNVNFYVDDVSMELYSGSEWVDQANQRIEQIRKRGLQLTLLSPDGNTLSDVPVEIRQIRHHFAFGTAISSGKMNNTPYKQFLRDHFEWAVCENATKWRQNEWTQGQPKYDQADEIVQFCRGLDIQTRGHCIFWAHGDRIPDWADPLSDNDLLQAMADRLQSVVSRYRTDFNHWDVNNEMLRNRYFADRFGDSIRPWMFQQARAIDPDCKLFVNDYSVVSGDSTRDYNDHIQWLCDNGAPVDAIGAQGHMGSGIIAPIIWDRLEILAEMGLPIWITEYDFDAVDENVRADGLENFYRIVFSHPSVEGILMWGFWENAHWRDYAHLVDSDWTVNAAGRRYEDLIDEWTTAESKQTDSQGMVTFRPFHGTHEILIDHPVYGTTLKTIDLLPDETPLQYDIVLDRQGLNYKYYEGSFNSLPDFDNIAPTSTGLTGTCNLRVADKVEQFALRFEGYLNCETAGIYTFYLGSDDGSRLFINDRLVINNDGSHTMKEMSASVYLGCGPQKIELQYFQAAYVLGLDLTFEGPGITRQPIAPDKLFQSGDGVFVPADFDHNSKVDLNDYAAFAACWQPNTGARYDCPCADLEPDGVIDLTDLAAFADHWLGGTIP